MKNNRLTARVMAVFAAVLLVTVLPVPAFAATIYEIPYFPDGYGRFDSSSCNYYEAWIPEGNYYVVVDGIRSVDPVSLYYEDNDGLSFCSVPVSFNFESNILNSDFVSVRAASVGGDGNYYDCETYFFFSGDSGGYYGVEGFILESAEYSPPALTDYITADTLPNVFNEIISLLPIVLGVLVGYIAIRKGISYLKSFLHNS